MFYKRFGHYLIQRRIGEGATGVVYLAEDLRLGRLVALKILKTLAPGDQTGWGQLSYEARLASSLNHPCICTVYDVGEKRGIGYMVLEYVDGVSLRELIGKGALPIGTVCRFGTQIAGALACAHEHGLLHRDVKPSNVLINSESDVKLIDFGVASRFLEYLLTEKQPIERSSPDPNKNKPVGTLPYIAPEIIRGYPASRQSDIWSLGVLLYLMVSGRLPFQGKSEAELTITIMVGEPPPLPRKTPAELAGIIGRALERNLHRRYSSARALWLELRGEGMKPDTGYRRSHA